VPPFRIALVVGVVLAVAVGLGSLLWMVLAPGGWSLAKLMMLLGFMVTAPWTGLCVANGVIGWLILVLARDPQHLVFPVPRQVDQRPLPPTAIALTVRNEDMAAVLPGVRRLLDGLDLTGHGAAFALFVLSDTNDPAAAAAEESAVTRFRAADRDPCRIRYRRRLDNAGFKAGNIMKFLDNQAEGFELMLTLDADSEMSAAAVLRLVGAMQAVPHLGIVQHLTVGLPARSAFPRLFQFGMRAGMRTWAVGQAWWQGDAGPYWGHNAVVRIAPFRAYARLPLLPGGHRILSHDQIEAALLRGAGWGVRVLPDEDGSWEANPPALPEHFRRESRWLAGNMQYWRLLRLPGLLPMGRWQLLQAILLFAGAPFYVLFLIGAATAAATDRASPFAAAPALALTVCWLAALYAPKLLGYLELAISRHKRACYGGFWQLLGGVAAETVFTLLMDAVSPLSKTIAITRLLLGASAGWAPQNRTDRGVGWGEAARLLWPHTLLGVVVFAAFASAGWHAALWALPLAGGLLVAIPLCVVTAAPWFGAWLRRRGIAAIPEEDTD
jgi:membrane glycosyltransferase